MSLKSRRATVVAVGLAGVVAISACSSNQPSGTPSSPGSTAGASTLKLMVGPGTPTDVTLLQTTVKPWEDRTGNKVEVVAAATDLDQELTQAFQAGSPPDLFLTDARVFGTYAKAGNLFAYGDQLDMKADFYPPLVSTFTHDGKFYCAPSGFTTLALVINTDLWTKAGLQPTEVPTTWAQLETVAQKLTSGTVKGLVVGDTIDRVGAFMKQAGGWVVNADQTAMTADTPTNLAGLTEVQKLLASGSASYPKGVGATSGAEALAKGTAAMTIEDTSFKMVAKDTNPALKWIAVELPAGPAAKGTLGFTQCYGVAAASKNQPAAVDLVAYLSTEQPAVQLAAGRAVLPPLRSAEQAYLGQFPSDKAFAQGASYAQAPVTVAGMDPVLKAFDTQLAGLPGADPKAMLQKLQKDGEAVLTQ